MQVRRITAGFLATFTARPWRIFLSAYHDSFKTDLLQGDGWRGFQLFKFGTGDRLDVRGLVMSNSCDIDPQNPRAAPSRVIFAPLVKLAAYEGLLRGGGFEMKSVDDTLAAIRAQKITNLFFLPAGGPLEEAHVVRLDEVHSMPVGAFFKPKEPEKLFTLSNTGFYMFVLKLSVHFCRLHEKINRNHALTAE